MGKLKIEQQFLGTTVSRISRESQFYVTLKFTWFYFLRDLNSTWAWTSRDPNSHVTYISRDT